jgi:hypothetical protein
MGIMKKRQLKRIAVYISILLVITACAETVSVDECLPEAEGYGFWSGLWHGLIAPVVFIVKLFSDDYVIYALNNNGNWYDFGYLFGLSISLGGGGRASKKK